MAQATLKRLVRLTFSRNRDIAGSQTLPSNTRQCGFLWNTQYKARVLYRNFVRLIFKGEASKETQIYKLHVEDGDKTWSSSAHFGQVVGSDPNLKSNTQPSVFVMKDVLFPASTSASLRFFHKFLT